MNFKFLLAFGLFCAVSANELDPTNATALTLIDEAGKKFFPYIEKASKHQLKCAKQLVEFATGSNYRTTQQDIRDFCDKATGLKEVKLVLNLASQTPRNLTKSDFECTLTPAELKQSKQANFTEVLLEETLKNLYALLKDQESACKLLEGKEGMPAFCEAKKRCKDPKVQRYMDVTLASTQAISQFLYSTREKKFGCPKFDIEINPALYHLKRALF